MNHKLVSFALSSTLALLAIFASTADAQDLQYKLKSRVPAGEQPAVVLMPGEPIKSVVLELQRNDGKKQKVKKNNLKSGKEVLLRFRQPEGSYSYNAVLKFVAKSGTAGEARFKFEAVVATAVKVSLIKTRSSLDKKLITLTANAPVSHADYEVLGDSGATLDSGTLALDAIKPGQDLQIRWNAAGAVSKINIKVFDPAGYWTSVQLIPFTVDIPHDEVEFDSGKSTFGRAEAAKLDKTYALLVDEIEKHGKDLEIQLYIAGYTDTVGAAGGNMGLSHARARAIAAYFRKKGIRIPIYFQGFGESVLAVRTADNVDEPRNRRALYILGNQAPPTSGQIPSGNWHRLQ